MVVTVQHLAAVFVLVMCLQVVAADSIVENASDQPVVINGRRLLVGQILTVEIQSGKSTGSVNMTHVRNVTNIQVRNGRNYYIIDNRSGTGIIYGRPVRTLDLVEGSRVESSF